MEVSRGTIKTPQIENISLLPRETRIKTERGSSEEISLEILEISKI
jgi:hypothetical protein